jgi:hypothetical protein
MGGLADYRNNVLAPTDLPSKRKKIAGSRCLLDFTL